jgi:hypothetical protein
VLSKYFYWLGLTRASDTADFTFVDGSIVHPNTSASPYAHWDWMYYTTRNFSMQCGMARFNSSYDYFLGGWPITALTLCLSMTLSEPMCANLQATSLLCTMPATTQPAQIGGTGSMGKQLCQPR